MPCVQVDGCEAVLEIGKQCTPCDCSCCSDKCRMVVTQLHHDRRICPEHLRGEKRAFLRGTPARWCQKVRYRACYV